MHVFQWHLFLEECWGFKTLQSWHCLFMVDGVNNLVNSLSSCIRDRKCSELRPGDTSEAKLLLWRNFGPGRLVWMGNGYACVGYCDCPVRKSEAVHEAIRTRLTG
uniref:Uncharacterized protein n=1 Tax=Eutreptiella gymnastica TaxID=73025 RepID=A0A7S1J097_9EUGL